MRSMTGYGKGIAEADGKKITIEVKTVNHRYLDFGLKFPKTFLFLEDAMKKQISGAITRGHIDMYLSYEQTESAKGGYSIDFELLENYLATANQIAEKSGLENDVTVSSLVRNGDIVTRAENQEDEALLSELTNVALENALNSLVDARDREGATIKADLEGKLDLKYDINKIEEEAKSLGMIKREHADNEYLAVEGDNEVIIYEDNKEENVGLSALLSAFGIELD